MASPNASGGSELSNPSFSVENVGTGPSTPTSNVPKPNTARLRDSPSSRRLNQQSSRERVDSILEVARARKLAMDRDTEQTRILSHDGTAEEESADEETSIVRWPSRQNTVRDYQAIQTQTQTQQPKLGSKKPTTSDVRREGRLLEEEQHADAEGHEHESWWARILSDYGSIELENKGSVARDHLALERTFLAWLRTSLAFASIGIAITQLFRLNTSSAAGGGDGSDPFQRLRQVGKPLGATFLGISIVMLFVGFHRYFESQHWIIRGKFPASRGSIALVTGVSFALIVTSLVVVVIVEPSQFEKR